MQAGRQRRYTSRGRCSRAWSAEAYLNVQVCSLKPVERFTRRSPGFYIDFVPTRVAMCLFNVTAPVKPSGKKVFP